MSRKPDTAIRIARSLSIIDTDPRPEVVDLSCIMAFAIHGEYQTKPLSLRAACWILRISDNVVWC